MWDAYGRCEPVCVCSGERAHGHVQYSWDGVKAVSHLIRVRGPRVDSYRVPITAQRLREVDWAGEGFDIRGPQSWTDLVDALCTRILYYITTYCCGHADRDDHDLAKLTRLYFH